MRALHSTVNRRAQIKDSVVDRIARVANHESYRRVMNNLHEEEGLVFGNVCLFDPGQLQALIELGKEPTEDTLAQVLQALPIAEKAAPDGTEYLHGITYWMVTGDHFYQIQHPALQAKAMEEYLTWLLRDQTKVIKPNHYVELQAAFDRSQIGDDLAEVHSVEIGGLVPETVRDEAPHLPDHGGRTIEVVERESIGDKVAQTFAQAHQILIDLFGTIEAQKIIDSVPPQASLEVKVNIGYRAKRRKFQKEFMSNLAAGLRNIPDGELRVRGKDGELKGNDARLSYDMSIKRHSDTSSLLDLEDTLRQMKEVHRRFLHDGRLEP
jgi:hypothetical protein